MNNEKLREWAENVELEVLPIRDPPSKHQRQIQLITGLVNDARDDPTLEVYEKLRNIAFIPVNGESKHVSYCRYLQHCVNLLDNILKDEGKMETLKKEIKGVS